MATATLKANGLEYSEYRRQGLNPDYSHNCDYTPVVCSTFRCHSHMWRDVTVEVLKASPPKDLSASQHMTLECENGHRNTYWARDISKT